MEYFAFGETFIEEHKNSHNSPYKYNGKELDEESGLYYYGARYYDPRISLMISTDQLMEKFAGRSPYEYCFSNPINLTDPTGMEPEPPLYHQFLISTAIKIYDQAKGGGASGKGALLMISHASLESGYGKAAERRGDYNLFGVSTNGNDYKARNGQIKIKDYSNIGGYDASIKDYISKLSQKWKGISELIKKENFTSDDVNKAFYTGKYIEGQKERNKTGHYSFNFDDVILGKKGEIIENNNEYGEVLLMQMNSVTKRLIKSIDYQVNSNNSSILNLNSQLGKAKTKEERENINTQISTLSNQNNKLLNVKKDIQ